jgi:hypothetical protein
MTISLHIYLKYAILKFSPSPNCPSFEVKTYPARRCFTLTFMLKITINIGDKYYAKKET